MNAGFILKEKKIRAIKRTASIMMALFLETVPPAMGLNFFTG